MQFPDATLADRVMLTPAERAMLIEQAERARVELDRFIYRCKHGTSGEALRAYVPATHAMDYASKIIGEKIRLTLLQGLVTDEG